MPTPNEWRAMPTCSHVLSKRTRRMRKPKQLGVSNAITVAVCIGSDLEASILTTAAVADLDVPNIWAKAVTTAHGRILTRVGAHNVVYPEVQMGNRVVNLFTGAVLEYVQLDDDFVPVETVTPAALVGKPLVEMNIRRDYKVTVVCTKPDDGGLHLRGERNHSRTERPHRARRASCRYRTVLVDRRLTFNCRNMQPGSRLRQSR